MLFSEHITGKTQHSDLYWSAPTAKEEQVQEPWPVGWYLRVTATGIIVEVL